jgi:hypothetical protein
MEEWPAEFAQAVIDTLAPNDQERPIRRHIARHLGNQRQGKVRELYISLDPGKFRTWRASALAVLEYQENGVSEVMSEISKFDFLIEKRESLIRVAGKIVEGGDVISIDKYNELIVFSNQLGDPEPLVKQLDFLHRNGRVRR